MIAVVIHLKHKNKPLSYDVEQNMTNTMTHFLDCLISGEKQSDKIKIRHHTAVGVQTHILCLSGEHVLAYEIIK